VTEDSHVKNLYFCARDMCDYRCSEKTGGLASAQRESACVLSWAFLFDLATVLIQTVSLRVCFIRLRQSECITVSLLMQTDGHYTSLCQCWSFQLTDKNVARFLVPDVIAHFYVVSPVYFCMFITKKQICVSLIVHENNSCSFSRRIGLATVSRT
jgi:hypothetical protein